MKPDPDRLLEHLKQVSRERNFETTPKTLSEIESYVKKEFLSFGYEVQEDSFLFLGQTFSNLIARLHPDLKRPRLIVGAHFDSVSHSPGADDNATGVASLLEAARIFAALAPSQENAFVEFAAFNLEEYGMVGSRSYAQKLKRAGVPILGMLSLEMIGYTSREPGSQKMPLFLKPFYSDIGNFVGLVANLKSKKFLREVEAIFRGVEELPIQTLTLPGKGGIFPETRLSDHSSFWDEGFAAILVTDTSLFRNPYYHTSQDRIETLDLSFLAKVTEATVRTILRFTS